MWKKKFILMIPMLLCVTLFCSCGKEKENQYIVPEWEDVYKEIIRNMESYLADPYIFRQEPDWANSDICIGYIGIHDFNDDGVPELIIGDAVSIRLGCFNYALPILELPFQRLRILGKTKTGQLLSLWMRYTA